MDILNDVSFEGLVGGGFFTYCIPPPALLFAHADKVLILEIPAQTVNQVAANTGGIHAKFVDVLALPPWARGVRGHAQAGPRDAA